MLNSWFQVSFRPGKNGPLIQSRPLDCLPEDCALNKGPYKYKAIVTPLMPNVHLLRSGNYRFVLHLSSTMEEIPNGVTCVPLPNSFEAAIEFMFWFKIGSHTIQPKKKVTFFLRLLHFGEIVFESSHFSIYARRDKRKDIFNALDYGKEKASKRKYAKRRMISYSIGDGDDDDASNPLVSDLCIQVASNVAQEGMRAKRARHECIVVSGIEKRMEVQQKPLSPLLPYLNHNETSLTAVPIQSPFERQESAHVAHPTRLITNDIHPPFLCNTVAHLPPPITTLLLPENQQGNQQSVDEYLNTSFLQEAEQEEYRLSHTGSMTNQTLQQLASPQSLCLDEESPDLEQNSQNFPLWLQDELIPL